MKILINDANILIDLVKIGLLDAFTNHSFKLYTTDFILAEINEDQKEAINELINYGSIHLITTSAIEDYQGIFFLLENSKGLSFEDCSAWYYCKKLKGTLVTGDARLRKTVEEDHIEVRGILFILDEILLQELISIEMAIQKIEALYQLNSRLPKPELDKRLMLWKSHYGNE